MARAITKGNEAYNVTAFECIVTSGSGTVDIASRVPRISIRASRDTGRYTAQVSVINTQPYRDADQSLDPGHTSDYNPAGVALLGSYHAVQVNIGKGGEAATRQFDGFVGPGSADPGEDVGGKDTFSCDFVGVMQPYADSFIDKEESRTYEDAWLSTGPNVLNTILSDQGFAPDIIVASNPDYYVAHYEIGDTNILEAIQRPVQAIGYCLEERYNAAAGEYRPTVIDPARTNFTPDIYLTGAIKTFRSTYTEANVRTKVRDQYRDRDTGKTAHTEAESAAALAQYGIPDGKGGRLHKYMRIGEEDGSWIDTRAESMTVAERALQDVSSPCQEATAEAPWLCLGVELGDLVRITTHSETIDIGVTEIVHDLDRQSGNLLGKTTLKGVIGQRVGNRGYWFNRSRNDWVGQQQRDRDAQRGIRPDAPTHLDAEGLWGEAEDGTTVPVLHLSWSGTRDWRTKGYTVQHRRTRVLDTGTATSGTVQTLTDAGATWVPHEHIGNYLYLPGTRGGEDCTRRIIANTTTKLTVESGFATAVGAEAYKILQPTTDWEAKQTDMAPFAQLDGPAGTYIVARVAAVPKSLER
jgi:hypothetical protein